MSESLDDLFTINVSATTDTQTRAGFGTALLAVQHVPWSSGALVREYASLAEVAAAGFVPTDPGYRMAAALFAQTPRPPSVKIGPRTAVTHVVRLTPTVQNDADYKVTFNREPLSYTSDGSASATEICSNLTALLDAELAADADAILATGGASSASLQTISGTALNGVVGRNVMSPARRITLVLGNSTDWDATNATVTGTDDAGDVLTETFAIPNNGNATVTGAKHFRTITSIAIPAQTGTGGTFTAGIAALGDADGSSNTHVDVTAAVAGRLMAFEALSDNLAIEDRSANGDDIEGDLDDLLVADPDFYALAIDSFAQGAIGTAAQWAETNRRLFVAQTADSACADPSEEEDLLSGLKDLSLGHTTPWYYPAIAAADGWLAAGILGDRLPATPGSDTWAYKTIAGVTVLPPSTTARAAVLAKNGNVYERKKGVAITFPGKVSLGEWVDVVRGLDWTRMRQQEALFALQLANPKIAFDDEGIGLVSAALYGVLDEGVANGLYAANPKPFVNAPLASATSSGDRSARRLTGVAWGARLAGAILTADVTGTATV